MKCFLTENDIGDELQPMRDKDKGQWEVRGGIIDLCLPNHLIFFSSSTFLLQISPQTVWIASFLRAFLTTIPVLCDNSGLMHDLALFPYHFSHVFGDQTEVSAILPIAKSCKEHTECIPEFKNAR